MRKLLAVLLLLLPVIGSAQAVNPVYTTLAADYDLDATANVYPRAIGPGNSAFAFYVEDARVENDESETEVRAVDATGQNPFNALVAGDLIYINVNGVVEERRIVTRTDADNIVVDKAIDLSSDTRGYQFFWRDFSAGNGAEDGWISVVGHRSPTFIIQMDQVSVATNTVEVAIQCRGWGTSASPVEVFAKSYADATVDADAVTVSGVTASSTPGYLPAVFKECRVGMHIDTADDGSDTGADAEQITVLYSAESGR